MADPDFEKMFGVSGDADPDFNKMFGVEEPPSGNYAQRTIANIPQSASGVWESMIHPERDVEGAWNLGRRIKRRLEDTSRPISVTHELGRLGRSIVSGIENLPTTFEKDPIGTAANVGLIAIEPEGAAAKAGEEAIATLPSRLQRLGKEGTAPPTVAEQHLDLLKQVDPEAAKRAGATPTPAAPAATEGYKAVGKGITDVKETAGPFSSNEVIPTLQDIRSELKKHSYDRANHRLAAKAMADMDRLLAKTTTTPEASEDLAKRAGEFGTAVEQARQKGRLRLETMPIRGGGQYTLHDVENAFDSIRKATSAKDKQSAMGHMMEEKLENHVMKLPGGADYLQRRSTYAQAKKLDTMEEIKRLATEAAGRRFNAAGWGHALATEMAKVSRNKKLLRLWTPEEQEHIKAFAGRKNIGEKFARFFSRANPTTWGGLVMDTLIKMAFGPIPAVITGTAGLAGRGVEKLIARRRLREFERFVAGSEEGLGKVIGPDALNTVKSTTDGKKALSAWKKKATGTTTRALALAIARAANMPQLTPRIENEINQIEPVSN